MILAWLAVLAVVVPALAATWLALTARARPARVVAIASAIALILGVVLGRGDLALQKTVSALIMPLGLWWVTALFVALWALARAPRAIGLAVLGLWLALTIMGNSWVSAITMTWLEGQVPERSLPAEPLDVIVVPGGGATYARDGSPQLSDYGDRLVLAARLYLAGRTRKLVTTGSSIAGIQPTQDLTAATRTLWRELGIPDDAIVGIAEPKNTSQEIAAVKAMAERERWTHVGMLGSAHHLPRILALCARANLDVYPIAADKRAADPIFHPLHAIPSPSSLRTNTMVAWELIGRAVGR